jgi:hypothetical protein
MHTKTCLALLLPFLPIQLLGHVFDDFPAEGEFLRRRTTAAFFPSSNRRPAMSTHPICTTAAVHLDKILAFAGGDVAGACLARTSKAMRARMASWRLNRLQTLQWWPLRLDGSTPEAREEQLRALGLRTWQHMPCSWTIALDALHQRLGRVMPLPAAYDASLEARLRPKHMVRRPLINGQKPDPFDGWTTEEGSDTEANAEQARREEARKKDPYGRHRNEAASSSWNHRHDPYTYLIHELPDPKDTDETTEAAMLVFATALATAESPWRACRSDENEAFDWLSRWFFAPGQEAWLASLSPTSDMPASPVHLLRLILFGASLHCERDAPWCHEWQSHQNALMLPIYTYPALSHIVSRVPCFRYKGRFLSLMVGALIYAEGNLGWGFHGVSIALINKAKHDMPAEQRIGMFVARAEACIDTYWPEFSRSKAYRAWIADEVETSTEYNDFTEWFDYEDEHAARFPLVICGEYWPRWQLWRKLANLACPDDSRWLSVVGRANDAENRPDFTQPHVLHPDGSIEALGKDTHVYEQDMVGYPHVTTPEERAAAFALRIKKSSSDTSTRFRRYTWRADDPNQLETHDIDISFVARVVPDKHETIDTWMTWTEDGNLRELRLGDLCYMASGELGKSRSAGDLNCGDDPRAAKGSIITDWKRCLAMQLGHKAQVPAWMHAASSHRAIYLECLAPVDEFRAWSSLRRDAEKIYH